MLSQEQAISILRDLLLGNSAVINGFDFEQRSELIYHILMIDRNFFNGKPISLDEVVRVIVGNNPNILNQSRQDIVPLNTVIFIANFDLINAFLNNGANPNYRHPKYNITPFDMLLGAEMDFNKRKQIIRILHAKGGKDCAEWKKAKALIEDEKYEDIKDILIDIVDHNSGKKAHQLLMNNKAAKEIQKQILDAIQTKNRQLIFELSRKKPFQQVIERYLESAYDFIIEHDIVKQQNLNISLNLTINMRWRIIMVNGIVMHSKPEKSIKECILFLGTLDESATKELLNSYHYQNATPFQLAIENGYFDIALVLFEHGANCYAQYKKTSPEEIKKFLANLEIFKTNNARVLSKLRSAELKELEAVDLTTKTDEEIDEICHKVIDQISLTKTEAKYKRALKIGNVLLQQSGIGLEIIENNIKKFLPKILQNRDGSGEEKLFLTLLINSTKKPETVKYILEQLNTNHHPDKIKFNYELLQFSFTDKDGNQLKFCSSDAIMQSDKTIRRSEKKIGGQPLLSLWNNFYQNYFVAQENKLAKRSEILPSATISITTHHKKEENNLDRTNLVEKPTILSKVVVEPTPLQHPVISNLLEAIRAKNIQEIIQKINESTNLHQLIEFKTQLELVIDFLKDPENQDLDLYLVLEELLIKIIDAKDMPAFRQVIIVANLDDLIHQLYKKSFTQPLQKDKVFYRKIMETFLDMKEQKNLPQINAEPVPLAQEHPDADQPEDFNLAGFDASLLFDKLKLALKDEIIIDNQELERSWKLLPEDLQLKLCKELSTDAKLKLWKLLPENEKSKLWELLPEDEKSKLFNILHKQNSAALVGNLSTITAQVRTKVCEIFGATKIGVSGSSVYHPLLQDFKGAEHFEIRKNPSDIDMFCVLPIGKMQELGIKEIEKLVGESFTDYNLVLKNGRFIHCNSGPTSVSFSLQHKQTGELIDLNFYDKMVFERFHQWQFGYDRLEIVWEGNSDGKLMVNGSQEDAADFCWQIYQEPEKFWQPNPQAGKFLQRLLSGQGCLHIPNPEILGFLRTAIGDEKIKSDLQVYLRQIQTSNPNQHPNIKFIADCSIDEDKSTIFDCLGLGQLLSRIAYQTPLAQPKTNPTQQNKCNDRSSVGLLTKQHQTPNL